MSQTHCTQRAQDAIAFCSCLTSASESYHRHWDLRTKREKGKSIFTYLAFQIKVCQGLEVKYFCRSRTNSRSGCLSKNPPATCLSAGLLGDICQGPRGRLTIRNQDKSWRRSIYIIYDSVETSLSYRLSTKVIHINYNSRQIIFIMSTGVNKKKETVLVVGATGNIGTAAVIGALRSGRDVLAVVRGAASADKLLRNVGSHKGRGSVTTVEADVLSEDGVQGVVDRVKRGELPAFQHVYSTGEWALALDVYEMLAEV